MDRLPYFISLSLIQLVFFYNLVQDLYLVLIPNKFIRFCLFFLLGFSAMAQHAIDDLRKLRQECDSLSCPARYAMAYRVLAEDLYIPLEQRLEYLNTAQMISQDLADNADLLAIFAQKGRIYLDRGRFIESLAAFGEGLPYRASKKDDEWREQEGWFLTGYGILLYRVKLFEDALSVFRDCASTMRQNKDDYAEAVALNNMALCFINLNDLDSANHYFKEAYSIRQKINEPFLLCHSLLYLARLQRLLNHPEQADSLLNIAQSYNLQSEKFEFQADIFSEWAELALNDRDYTSAAHYLNRAKEMQSSFRDLRWLQLKIQLFEELNLGDSLSFYIDSALVAAEAFGNLDLSLSLIHQKETFERKEGRLEVADALLQKALDISLKLNARKDSIQQDMMRVQREYTSNRERVKKLEAGNAEKERIIANQNRNLIFVSIIALTLLGSFIVYYRISQRVRKLSRDVRLMYTRSKLAAEQLTVGIFAADAEGKLIFINHVAREHFKTFNGEALLEGIDFLSQLKNPDLRKDWELRLAEIKTSTSFQNISSRLKEGRTFFHLVSISALQSKGRSEGMVAVITDVTSSQEKSLALSQKTRALEQSNEAKEKILSLLAHDLKEGVVGSLELTRLSLDTEDIEEQRLHLKMIFESLSRTKTMLFKTLDWVQHQSNGLSLRRTSFKLQRLVQDVIKEIEGPLTAKQVQCMVAIESDLEVIADPNALRVVIRNLLSNALKFVPKEQGIITIRSKVVDHHQIELAIEDNGIGMNALQIGHLMSGTKLDSTPGTAGEIGTGIGLSFCQDLLYKMGSTLKVESSTGEGTVFYFSLDSPQEARKQ